MSTSQKKTVRQGRQIIEQIDPEKVEILGKNVADIVLGKSQKSNGKPRSHSKGNCNLTFEKKDSIFQSNIQQNSSKRCHRLLKQVDCKDHSHAERKITKQGEFQLDSSSDSVYFVSSVDRKERGSKKLQEDDLEERNLYRKAIARSQSHSRKCKRSSYPPRGALPKSDSPLWVEEELQAVKSCPTLRKESRGKDNWYLSRGSPSMEYSAKAKPHLCKGGKQEPLTCNGESKQSFERIRSNSTGGRMTGKGIKKKTKDTFDRKPPKAPSWQSLLNPSPVVEPTSSSSEKKKLSNKTEPKLPPETVAREQRTEGPRPPKPPSWQSLTIPPKCQPTVSLPTSSVIDQNHTATAQSSNSSENGVEQTIYSEDVDDDSVSEISVQSETAEPFQRPTRRINIKRTRSRLIDSSEVPKQHSVVRLAQAKPCEYNLRETQFDNMVYLRENAERCQRWLQSLDDRVVNGSSYLNGKSILNGKNFSHEKYNFVASPYPSSDSTQDTL